MLCIYGVEVDLESEEVMNLLREEIDKVFYVCKILGYKFDFFNTGPIEYHLFCIKRREGEADVYLSFNIENRNMENIEVYCGESSYSGEVEDLSLMFEKFSSYI